MDAKRAGESLSGMLEGRALDKLMILIKLGADPAAIQALLDTEAKKIVQTMTPAEIARYCQPTGELVTLDQVPDGVVEDHLQRYTMDELRRGQFVVIDGSKRHYLFIMDTQTKERLEREEAT